ncbi:MAG: two-component system response regulator [Desulfuromonas sp.]|nr:MAG: two-component system response regulator [Desulfuromonas sp.]
MNEDYYQNLTILIVDDEASWLRALGLAIERNLGARVVTCQDSRAVLALLEEQQIDLVILDITMPYLSGDELLTQLKEKFPQLPAIMTTGLVQVELAVKCMRLGAFDYYVKTTEVSRILNGIRKALELVRLQNENQLLRDRFLKDDIEHQQLFSDLTSQNKKMRAIFQYIEAIAPGQEPVLILGESGTGKELIARAIHRIGHADGPWVAVNAAGLDDNVFSDTLFGHCKGAFTGADQDRPGMIEQAAGGLLFLDEIGDLSMASQVKLLRLLQEGEYYPLGSDKPKQHNTRFVFATNRDLSAMQKKGEFRTDLYYRLRAYRVALPPLRERLDDLPLLVEKFVNEAAESLSREGLRYDPQLISLLQRYRFPGNVRELRSMLFEAASLAKSDRINASLFNALLGDQLSGSDDEASYAVDQDIETIQFPRHLPTLKQAADLLVEEAMQRADGNQTRAAKMLGISRPALSKRLKNLS